MSTWRWMMQLHRHLQPDTRRTLRMESLKPTLAQQERKPSRSRRWFPLARFSIYFRLQKKAPPTRTERLGHQPRQAAGNLGSGEVIMVEALDGGDDEGPSHPAVIRRVSHLRARRAPPLCSWRFTQPREFLLTADDIPHGGIQRGRGKKNPLLEPQKKKKIKVWQRLGDCEHDGSEKQQVPAYMSAILQGYFLFREYPYILAPRRSLGFLKISSIPWHSRSPGVQHSGAAARRRRKVNPPDTENRPLP